MKQSEIEILKGGTNDATIDEVQRTTSRQTIAKPNVTGSENQTTGVGVYCKCGGIIYCCTDAHYSEKGGRKEVDAYFAKGYQVGRISKGDVQRLFGCKCQPKLF